ncbi:unnamed protein product [Fusarium venenatum]|uniref:Condensation domain-containing protein n=1 Tax=Fusarium venenatum TaxID=56646 RepID=A0A2L2TGZ7_9HYPO|nr:uncharacterized protein FVRRES_06742 [Fusarium venenatum]CEI62306.1 unnamed protein product [Fusarium venenatum]
MAEYQLPKIRPLGKLEEITAAAHHIEFFTNCAFSAHYRASKPLPNFGLEPLVLAALSQVLHQHPILFAVPVVPDTEQSHWGRLASIDLRQVSDNELDSLLENQHNTSFKTGYGTLPVWRLIILQDYRSKDGFVASFVYHHSMCDGVSSQIFQDAFQSALCNISSSSVEIQAVEVVFSDDSAISSPLEDLHSLPLPENPLVPDAANLNEWRGSTVSVPCKTRYKSLSLAPEVLRSFAQKCKKNKTTVTAALPALVAKALYDSLPSTTEALTCNLPVSLRSDLPPKQVDNVLGNFIDAFKVQLLRSDLDQSSDGTTAIWKHAKKVQQATRRYFTNTSPSGEPYANVAVFKLIPDIKAFLASNVGNPRGESFEISNLGHFLELENLKGDGNPFWRRGKLLLSRYGFRVADI